MGDTTRTLWPDGCGNGRWCAECRLEIREEALLWLRELNVLPSEQQSESLTIILRSWERHLLKAKP